MSHTSRHAIRDWLAGLEIRPLNDPMVVRMRPDTLRFVKMTEERPHQLWYVTCDADDGKGETVHWHWTVLATREVGQWTAHGVAGDGSERGLPERGHPWANLGGGWGSDGFRAGGTVEDAGKGIVLVRLRDREGRVFEDTVDQGIVLFLSNDPVVMPMRVELLDSRAVVVGGHDWGFADE
jgi:hypothetical protein